MGLASKSLAGSCLQMLELGLWHAVSWHERVGCRQWKGCILPCAHDTREESACKAEDGWCALGRGNRKGILGMRQICLAISAPRARMADRVLLDDVGNDHWAKSQEG